MNTDVVIQYIYKRTLPKIYANLKQRDNDFYLAFQNVLISVCNIIRCSRKVKLHI